MVECPLGDRVGYSRTEPKVPHNNQCVRTSSARARTTCRLVKRPSTIKEVLDVDGMWVGPAPAADHVRCAGGGVGRVVAGPCVAAGSGTVPTMAPGRRDSSSAGRAGGVGGGGL